MTSIPGKPPKTAIIVAQKIVADINRRGNEIGDRLPPERVMLESYEVGRGTLRESLRFLELQGVLSLKPGPGGGPVVQQPDAASLATSLMLLLQFSHVPFRTVAEARVGLEPLMTHLAATRMSDETMSAVQNSVEKMRDNLGDQEIFLEENKRFHELIAHGSGNAIFGYVIDALLGILDGSAIGIDYPEHRRIRVIEAHSGIFEALQRRDAEASSQAMADHIEQYVNYAQHKFPEILDAPIVWRPGN